MNNDVLLKRQNKYLALGITLLIFCICLMFLIQSVNGITLEEIKSYVIPQTSSGSTQINNYYSNVYYSNYTLSVQALTSSPADNVLNYFGNKPSVLATAAGQNKIYIRKNGNITRAEIYQYSGTAGTAEKYNLTIIKNGVVQTSLGFIAETLINTNERIFSNTTMKLQVLNGDYIELMFKNPPWVTNPLTTITGGYLEVSA